MNTASDDKMVLFFKKKYKELTYRILSVEFTYSPTGAMLPRGIATGHVVPEYLTCD